MNRIALVTGIGAATCLALKAAGYQVVANYFGNDAEAKEFASASELPVYACDVADLDACAKGVTEVTAKHGPVDVLVNNAGITADAMLHKMTGEQWRSVIDIDLGGCFNMCRTVIEGMRGRHFGRIVNISSVNGLSGQAGQTNWPNDLIAVQKRQPIEQKENTIISLSRTPEHAPEAFLASMLVL
ncbi:MAG: SDR family NAD(P)-dependent oxidoreductase [Flavobacteriaceae bacterium]